MERRSGEMWEILWGHGSIFVEGEEEVRAFVEKLECWSRTCCVLMP